MSAGSCQSSAGRSRNALAAVAVVVLSSLLVLTAAVASTGSSVAAAAVDCGPERTLAAAADAWIDQNSPATNKGSDSILKVVSKQPTDNTRALVRFALPAAPAGCVLDSAALRLYAASAAGGRTLQALRLAGSWTESGVTWGNQPATAGTAATAASGAGYREWDVSPHVQAMYAGPNDGFLIRDAVENAGGAEQQLHSREKGETPPQLVLRFRDGEPPPPDTTPPDTSIDSGPSGTTTSTEATFTFSSTEPGSTFACSRDGAVFVTCVSPVSYSGLAVGGHEFRVRATDAAGNVDTTPATRTWTVAAPTADETVVYALGDGADGSSLSRALASYVIAQNPDRFFYLGDVYETGTAAEFANNYDPLYGALAVKTDPVLGNHESGNRNSGYYPYWQGKRGWTQEQAKHRSYVDPSGWQVIAYSSEEANMTAEAGWVAAEVAKHAGDCRIVMAHKGRHVVVDTAHGDNVEQEPVWAAIRGKTALNLVGHNHIYGRLAPVDGVTVIVSGAGGHGLRSLGGQHHTVVASKTLVATATRLVLRPGEAAFSQVDASGNVYDSGVVTCTPPPPPDTTPPDTTITSRPSDPSSESTATFEFAGSDDRTPPALLRFDCRLDGQPAAWAACTSPRQYTGLGAGSHTFEVRAVDQAGNVDATPASFAWTIVLEPPPDTTPPETTITSAPPATTVSTSASFSFVANEPGSTFECSLDGAAFAACTSPKQYAGLGLGGHRFRVRALDPAANVDPTPAEHTWTIGSCSASTVTVGAAADSWLLQSSSSSNFGNDSVLKVDTKAGANARAIVRFNLPALPSGCAVTSATLRLFASSYKEGRTLQALQVAAAWTEGGVTWSNQPATTGPAATTAAGSGYRAWAVTAQVQGMYASSNHGFLVRDATEGGGGLEQGFHSREKGADQPPQLVITFG